jgi:hypothetical protein
MANFRPIDRETLFLLPPSVDEWLPERHLARFVVEVIDGFDLRAMSGCYRGSGSACYHPRMLLGILVYGYATGVFSSRKLERATYDSVAFRFIAANDHMWTAPASQGFGQRFDQIACVHMSGLLLRRIGTLAKMASATRVPNIPATFSGRWSLRSVSRLGSIDHTICSFACKFWHRLSTVAFELLPVSG